MKKTEISKDINNRDNKYFKQHPLSPIKLYHYIIIIIIIIFSVVIHHQQNHHHKQSLLIYHQEPSQKLSEIIDKLSKLFVILSVDWDDILLYILL